MDVKTATNSSGPVASAWSNTLAKSSWPVTEDGVSHGDERRKAQVHRCKVHGCQRWANFATLLVKSNLISNSVGGSLARAIRKQVAVFEV